MGARDLIVRGLRTLVRASGGAAEGEFRPGPYQLPVTGGWLPDGAPINWWQLGMNPQGIPGHGAMVEACISAYSQTVAMCPGSHWRMNSKNGRDRVTNSALSRILRRPNDYQSISDFMLNLVRSLYYEGNAYALCLRNDRFEIDEVHLMDPRQSRPQLAITGDVFYTLGGNNVIMQRLAAAQEQFLVVPQRDVLHVRLHCMERKQPFPLRGETPLIAAYGDIETTDAIMQQQIQFYRNEARPSAVLSTDLPLDKDLVQALTDRWNEKSKGLHQGKTPILTHGLKVQPWVTPGKDAQLVEMMKLSQEHIALAFRIPLQILGIGGTPYSSTELLMQSWIASGLGFALNHIEESFGVTFDLWGQPDEYVEFDTAALLRSAMKDRIEALTRGVQGGIYSPNEAREVEGFAAAEFGDEPRLQAQVVPLSVAGKIPTAPTAPAADAAPGAPQTPADTKPPPDQPKAPPKDYDTGVKNHVRHILTAADRHDRARAAPQ
jgi:HK97 family phage portal protein